MSISLSEQRQVQGGSGVIFGAPVVNSASVFIPIMTGFGSGTNISSDGANVWDAVVDQVNGWYAYDLAMDMTNLKQGRVSCFTNTAGSAGTKVGFIYAPDLTTVGSDLAANGGLYVPVDASATWTDSGWLDLIPGITGIQHIHLASIGGNNWVNSAAIAALYLMFK